MRRAIQLATEALGTTSPNPAVGCVVLDTELRVVGEGFTFPPGGPHAEVNALRAAGDRARGGVAVVTLEPCNHYGRTPPCTDALISAGIHRVVFAVRDPTLKGGGGADALREAGLDVEAGVLADEAARGNEAWLTCVNLRRPFVTWVYGTSVDGWLASADGTSPAINCEEALLDAHGRIRAESDAVVVGSGTIGVGDPNLSARARAGRQPLTVIVDMEARTSAGARIFEGPAPALIAVANDADASHLAGKADVLRLPRRPDRTGLDVEALLSGLYEREVCAVMLDGAPTLAASFIAADLIDRVIAYVAPVLMGNGGGSALMGAGARSIASARRLRLDEVSQVGTDVRITARRPRPSRGAVE